MNERLLTDEEIKEASSAPFVLTGHYNIRDAQDAKSVAEDRKEIGEEMVSRGTAGFDALADGEQGFWKGYWQAYLDKGASILKGEKP